MATEGPDDWSITSRSGRGYRCRHKQETPMSLFDRETYLGFSERAARDLDIRMFAAMNDPETLDKIRRLKEAGAELKELAKELLGLDLVFDLTDRP
jgi:hypothetical protein